jgi:small subunit ribosomal protein S17
MEEKIEKVKVITRKKGVVVSDKMDKTVIVAVDTLKTHPKYKKKFKSTKKYAVHDESNKHKIGDMVEFISAKPISKKKRFILVA